MSEGDDRKQEPPRWAADEPTAMWDEGALEQKGLDTSKKPGDPAPAPAPAAKPAAGLSWPLTIGVAIVVAVAVYFLVRALRG